MALYSVLRMRRSRTRILRLFWRALHFTSDVSTMQATYDVFVHKKDASPSDMRRCLPTFRVLSALFFTKLDAPGHWHTLETSVPRQPHLVPKSSIGQPVNAMDKLPTYQNLRMSCPATRFQPPCCGVTQTQQWTRRCLSLLAWNGPRRTAVLVSKMLAL